MGKGVIVEGGCVEWVRGSLLRGVVRNGGGGHC